MNLRDYIFEGDPRRTARSFSSVVDATEWADTLAWELWNRGGDPEARLIRRALGKTSSMLHTALYWRPRINLERVIPGDNRLAFNDMNLYLFDYFDNVLCQHKRSTNFVAGPRESGKTIFCVEIAPVYGGLPSLTRRELEALYESGILNEWDKQTIKSLSTQWTPYCMVISDTGQQAERHVEKVKEFLLGD